MTSVAVDRPQPRYPAARRVVLDESIVAPVQGYSPSAQKPHVVIAAWRTIWPDLLVRPPLVATFDELCRAYEERYITDLLAGRIANAFDKA